MQNFNRVIRSALVVGTTVLATLGGISSAQAVSLPGPLEDKLVAVCQAIKDDSRIALHKAVKNSGVSYRRLARGLVCDGMDMYTFALQHGAENTGAVIARRTNLADESLTAKQ